MPTIGPKHYDAFLSFNSLDHLAVHELAERLKGEGLVLYLEEWELSPGLEIQPALAEGLRDSKTCVVFLGSNGLGPWQKLEVQVAIYERAIDEAFHVIPVLLPGAKRPQGSDLPTFLKLVAWVEFQRGLDDEQAFHLLVSGIRGLAPSKVAQGGAPMSPPTGYDLRLTPLVHDVGGIPTTGKSLMIVATVKNVLHFRIFHDDGQAIVDTDETKLTAQAELIEDLRKQLKSLWPPHELTKSEKARVIAAVTSIAGHTPPETVRVRAGLADDASQRYATNDKPTDDIKDDRLDFADYVLALR